jgi:DNA-binding response OmpR family regulator
MSGRAVRRACSLDDEQPIRAIVRGFLERDGAVVAEADGPSAVEQVRTFAPDVVVLDIMLPGFDGLEVLQRVRSFADPLVIFLTARTEEVDRSLASRSVGTTYLTKPFSWRARGPGGGPAAPSTAGCRPRPGRCHARG